GFEIALPFSTPPDTIVFFTSGVGFGGGGGGGGSSPPATTGPVPVPPVPPVGMTPDAAARFTSPTSLLPCTTNLETSRATSFVVSFATSFDLTTGAMTEIS